MKVMAASVGAFALGSVVVDLPDPSEGVKGTDKIADCIKDIEPLDLGCVGDIYRSKLHIDDLYSPEPEWMSSMGVMQGEIVWPKREYHDE